MTRVSLKEAYDNKDVVAQIYAIRDIAEGAENTANGAVSTANTASEHVDVLVPQVEGAVQNANNASASAQQSATTVAGYDARLTAVEDADSQNVKLDTKQVITGTKTFNVKGDPIIIQTPDIDGNSVPSNNLYSEIGIRDSAGREIAYFIRRHQANGDANVGMVCKHTRLGISADVGAFVANDGKTYGIAPTPTNGAPSYAIATKGYVESTDGETNNLVHRTTNEKVDGIKTFVQRVDFDSSTVDLKNPPSYVNRGMSQVNTGPNLDVVAMREEMLYSAGGNSLQFTVHAYGEDEAHTAHTASLMLTVFRDGTARLRLVRESGTVEIVPRG